MLISKEQIFLTICIEPIISRKPLMHGSPKTRRHFFLRPGGTSFQYDRVQPLPYPVISRFANSNSYVQIHICIFIYCIFKKHIQSFNVFIHNIHIRMHVCKFILMTIPAGTILLYSCEALLHMVFVKVFLEYEGGNDNNNY